MPVLPPARPPARSRLYEPMAQFRGASNTTMAPVSVTIQAENLVHAVLVALTLFVFVVIVCMVCIRRMRDVQMPPPPPSSRILRRRKRDKNGLKSSLKKSRDPRPSFCTRTCDWARVICITLSRMMCCCVIWMCQTKPSGTFVKTPPSRMPRTSSPGSGMTSSHTSGDEENPPYSSDDGTGSRHTASTASRRR